ncbi:MAG: ATP-binding protein [Nannocystaceae bacterium]
MIAGLRTKSSIAVVLAMAVAYHVAAQASLLLAIPPGFASPVWPAAGIAFVGMLRYGYRVWSGVFLGSLSINLLISGGLDVGLTAQSLVTAASIGAGATVQAVLATVLIRRYVDPSPWLVGGGAIGRFFLLSGPVACLVNSVIGAATLVVVGTIPASQFLFTWWTWWTGDVLGVMTMAPILLSMMGAPREVWRPRRRSVAIPLCVALALLFGIFVVVRRSEADRQRDEFAVEARALVRAIEQDIDAHLEPVESVARLGAHIDRLTPEDFGEFAADLLSRGPSLRSLQWSPREAGPRGSAAAYVVRPSTSPAASEDDVPPSRAVIDRARDTGTPTLEVVGAPPRLDVTVVVPVYERGQVPATVDVRRRRLVGHALGTIDVSALVDASLRGSSLHHVDLRIRERDDPEAVPLLARTIVEQGHEGGTPPTVARRPSSIDWVGTLSIADHTWRVELEPTTTFFVASRPWSAWIVAASGLSVIGLLGAFLLLLTGQTQRIQREVEVQTEELARANAALQQEITEREQTEVALRQAKDAAESATRAKSEFLARMSHEIRTPMNAIMGMTELILDTELSAEQRESLETVSHAGGALAGLLDDILDVSKVEVGKIALRPEVFSLRGLLQHLEKLLGGRIEQAELCLRVEVAPSVPARLYGDPARLKQVFINLLSNAMKFTDPGGEIDVRVTTSLDSSTRAVELRCSVRDTGMGISERDQRRIFQSFEQVDGSSTRAHGGAGLGLAITAHLVQLMGGSLQVSSELGRGSAFEFTVALREAGSDASDRVESASEDRPVHTARPLRILLAEDNAINQRVAVAMLTQAGHDVVVVDDGQQAVDRRRSDRFDVVLMDIQMPVMDGIKAANAIRAHERAAGLDPVPIIALTAHAVQDDVNTRIRTTMDGYLTKPIRKARLWEALEQLAERAGRSGGQIDELAGPPTTR